MNIAIANRINHKWITTCKHIFYHYKGMPTDGTDESFYLSHGSWSDSHGYPITKQEIRDIVINKGFTHRTIYRVGYYYLDMSQLTLY